MIGRQTVTMLMKKTRRKKMFINNIHRTNWFRKRYPGGRTQAIIEKFSSHNV